MLEPQKYQQFSPARVKGYLSALPLHGLGSPDYYCRVSWHPSSQRALDINVKKTTIRKKHLLLYAIPEAEAHPRVHSEENENLTLHLLRRSLRVVASYG